MVEVESLTLGFLEDKYFDDIQPFPTEELISVHPANTTVALVAQPDEGYQFVKWTGDVDTIADVYAASTTIAMNASYAITAKGT